MKEQEMKMLTTLIPAKLHTDVKVEASRNGEKLKEYVAKVLQDAVDKAKAERKGN